MAFDPLQLDEIRARIPVSEVVGARFPLIRKGAEYVVKDNESFTVNDQKKFWCEFGKGGDGKPHDIFDFLQAFENFTFVGAVEELAKKAGITLAQRPGRSPASAGQDRSYGSHAEANRDDRGDQGAAQERPQGKREIVNTWSYFDPENVLLYQTVRMQERMPDGSWLMKDGKPWKTFFQRRPSPDGDGSFVMGLEFVDKNGEPHQFIRSRNGGWLRATEQRRGWWPDAEIKTFASAGNVEHWLYNANDVIDELQEPKDDQRTIFLPEGEKKVDVLKEWGLLATTNSGGAKHFTEACAEFFRGASHVVLLQDNDRAGAERVAKIAPMLKAVDVELVQVLNFRDVWPACPVKGDVGDWRDKGGGTKDALLEIIDGLKPWTPEPYRSKFGAKTVLDLGAPARAYPWRIKGLLPMLDNALFMGPSRSGKTFEVLDVIMHVMRGEPFAGRKVVPGGYVYLTYEGATGFENRLRAYLKHHEMRLEDLHSFAWLTRPPNMFANEDNVKALGVEISKLAESFRLPLAGTVVDTHNSATRGSSEVKSDDINRIMHNYETVKETTGAPLIIIGHTNAEGRHRGNEQLFNNIEAAILVERVYTDAKHTQERRDDDGRVIRRGKINKQREGDDRTSWEFVLQEVQIGTDEDGDPITSMVSVEPAQHVPDNVAHDDNVRVRPEGFYLKGNNVDVFRALLKAVDGPKGLPPPPELSLPSSITRVVKWVDMGIEYKRSDPQDEGESLSKYSNRIKARLKRFRDETMKYSVIGIASVPDASAPDPDSPADKPRMIHYVWPTGRKVFGKGLPQWPPQPKKKKEPDMLLAPGESGLPPDVF